MASSVGNGCGRPLVVCCIRVSMGWGTSFGSDLWHALSLCLSCCYVTPRVTPFAQTHPVVGNRRRPAVAPPPGGRGPLDVWAQARGGRGNDARVFRVSSPGAVCGGCAPYPAGEAGAARR